MYQKLDFGASDGLSDNVKSLSFDCLQATLEHHVWWFTYKMEYKNFQGHPTHTVFLIGNVQISVKQNLKFGWKSVQL